MRVLLIEDRALDASEIMSMLSTGDALISHVHRVDSLEDARTVLEQEKFDVLILDLALQDAGGSATIGPLLQEDDSTPLLVLSDCDNVSLAVDMVRLGAQDYLVKGQFTPQRISRAIRYAVERKQKERRLHYLVAFDQLTGLANRQRLFDVMHGASANATRHGLTGALLYLDLDRFKFVNDRAGHAGGDDLLVAVASRLRSVVRAGDTVARLGGDEFAVLLPELNGDSAATAVADKILEALRRPFRILDQTFSISASIGITLFPMDGDDVAGLLRNADLAMYQAKRAGPGKIRFYTSALNQEAASRQKAERHLQDILKNNDLRLRYSPIRNLNNGTLLGFSADIHVCMSTGNIVPLDEVTEHMTQLPGLHQVGLWAMEQVSRDLGRWQAEGLSVLSIRIRAFESHWHHEGFVSEVANCIDAAGIPPQLLRIQVPESLLHSPADHFADHVAQLEQIGVSVTLDHFATTHCSLLNLHDLPVDELLVDPSLIAAMDNDRVAAAIVEAIVAVASSAGKTTVAAGVQTAKQANELRRIGCRWAQGPRFDVAVDRDEVQAMLGEHTATDWPQLHMIRTGTT
ncbi:MAG: diguanylate cyclase [Gammaproteobacteria bacterium]